MGRGLSRRWPPTSLRQGNPYITAVWTPLYKRGVQRCEPMGSDYPYTHNQRSMGKSRESEGMCNRENSSIRHGSNTTRIGFSESPASGGVDAGQWTEDEIAEAIFDWWISGKPYKQWYAEKYLQHKIDFDEHKE